MKTLEKNGVTARQRVAVCDTSSGGFLAFHFAAADPRVKAAAGISPVTRLTALLLGWLTDFMGQVFPLSDSGIRALLHSPLKTDDVGSARTRRKLKR